MIGTESMHCEFWSDVTNAFGGRQTPVKSQSVVEILFKYAKLLDRFSKMF
ncbi:uncharacterized protein METZ01_LOCUS385078, partial [marine metagenome]